MDWPGFERRDRSNRARSDRREEQKPIVHRDRRGLKTVDSRQDKRTPGKQRAA
jgi:hypothetical protein